eukprot:Skav200491  [mRNA]  locus=scaffold450:248268:250816:- [translate_table: standard]
MTVEAQTRFQAERISGSQPCQAHFCLRPQQLPHGHRGGARHKDLKAILTSVATPRDQALGTFQGHPEALTKWH